MDEFCQFQFFEQKECAADDPLQKLAEILKDRTNLTANACGFGMVAVGDSNGKITLVFGQQFQAILIEAFQGMDPTVCQLKIVKCPPSAGSRSALIAVGRDGAAMDAPYFLKVWNLDKITKSVLPQRSRKIELPKNAPFVPLTSMYVMEDLSCAVLGFGGNGAGIVVWLKGDLLRDRNIKQKSVLLSEIIDANVLLEEKRQQYEAKVASIARGADKTQAAGNAPKPGRPYPTLVNPAKGYPGYKEANVEPVQEAPKSVNFDVTGVCFVGRPQFSKMQAVQDVAASEEDKGITGAAANPNLVLVAILREYSIYLRWPRDNIEPIISFDGRMRFETHGCESKCWCPSEEGGVWVCSEDSVHHMSEDGTERSLAFPVSKEYVFTFHNYVCVVTGSSTTKEHTPTKSRLYIFDIRNLIKAHDKEIDPVSQVMIEWNYIMLICQYRHNIADSRQADVKSKTKLMLVTERDVNQKLNALFKRNMYQQALTIAEMLHLDSSRVAWIYEKWADHLYSNKNDWQGSVHLYVKTMGYLEPSFVIGKFLDPQRIDSLTVYLQALHERGLANADHTTLLLNCYIKLKDEKRISSFVEGDNAKRFDQKTATQVCHVLRQNKYPHHALCLARTHNLVEWELKVLMEDDKNYLQALELMATLSLFEAEQFVRFYGKELMREIPGPMTSFLVEMSVLYTPGRKAYLSATADKTAVVVPVVAQKPVAEAVGTVVYKPRCDPKEYLHVFMGRPGHMIKFLETVMQQLSEPDQSLCHTLLEVYLQSHDELVEGAPDTQLPVESSEDRRKKALALLKEQRPDSTGRLYSLYDSHRALVLCEQYDFQEGLLFLYERIGLHHEMLRYYMKNKNNAKVLETCEQASDSGNGGPAATLYMLALAYFADQENCEADLINILDKFEEKQICPPLLVIQLLAQHPNVSLRMVKKYLEKRMTEEKRNIDEAQHEIELHEKAIKEAATKVEEHKLKAKVFHNSKCAKCNSALDPPSVHFFCDHAYHLRCLPVRDDVPIRECYLCASTNRDLERQWSNVVRQADDNDQFFKDVNRDGFSAVAARFSYGLFTN